MNLYLVSRTDDIGGYDEYDAFVCAAESEEQALSLHPDGGTIEEYFTNDGTPHLRACDLEWRFGERAVAEYIGKADEKYTKPTVILASFNAG